jgi:hypothetical protein
LALTKEKKLYEFLIRFNPETNEVMGAHVQYANVIKDGGTVEAVKPGPAEKIAILDGDFVGLPLADILGQAIIDQQNANDTLTIEKSDLTVERDNLAAKVHHLQIQIKKFSNKK